MIEEPLRECLTFDDVLLVPAFSAVLPRDVQTRTRLARSIELGIPLVSAAMDSVTEARTAITMAREGGLGILHKSMSQADQDERDADPPQPDRGSLGEFDQRHQDQHGGRIFGEIGMSPHPLQHLRIAAVAEHHLVADSDHR